MQDTLEHKEVHIRAVKLFKYALQCSKVHEIKLLHNKIIFLLSSVCVCFGFFVSLFEEDFFFWIFFQYIKKTLQIFILKDTIVFSFPSFLRQLHL